MKAKTQQLLDKLEDSHDWAYGQCWQWEATGVTLSSICRICGMEWTRYRNGQNSPDHDSFTNTEGDDLTLRDAVQDSCFTDSPAKSVHSGGDRGTA